VPKVFPTLMRTKASVSPRRVARVGLQFVFV
jgi:hypothetical protein